MGRKPTGRVRLQDPVTKKFVWVEPSQIHGPADGEEETAPEEPAQARPEALAPTIAVSSPPPAPIAPAPAPAQTTTPPEPRPRAAPARPARAPRAEPDTFFDALGEDLDDDDEDELDDDDESVEPPRPRAAARVQVESGGFFDGDTPGVEDVAT